MELRHRTFRVGIATAIHIIAEMPEGGIRAHGFLPFELAIPERIPPDRWGNLIGTLEEVIESRCQWWATNGIAFEEIEWTPEEAMDAYCRWWTSHGIEEH